MNDWPRSLICQQLQNAKNKVVGGQIGDSSSTLQLVYLYALKAGDTILCIWDDFRLLIIIGSLYISNSS